MALGYRRDKAVIVEGARQEEEKKQKQKQITGKKRKKGKEKKKGGKRKGERRQERGLQNTGTASAQVTLDSWYLELCLHLVTRLHLVFSVRRLLLSMMATFSERQRSHFLEALLYAFDLCLICHEMV